MSRTAQSIRQRLLNIARNEDRNFQELVQYFAMNRFLCRLAHSKLQGQFVLKGAYLMHILNLTEARATMDIDLLGKMTNDSAILKQAVIDILTNKVEDDGLEFIDTSIHTSVIAQQARYSGVRVELIVKLGAMVIPLKIDTGFGDTVYPNPVLRVIPSLLGLKSGKVFCYTIETSIAEKTHTMLVLEELNSRMKDFYDIWLYLNSLEVDHELFSRAVASTFKSRKTEINLNSRVFTKPFRSDPRKQRQWEAFLRKRGIRNAPSEFSKVVSRILIDLEPIILKAKKVAELPEH